jgi:hypothetical protein
MLSSARMSKMFIGRFVTSILAILLASSVLLTHGQSQSEVLSDEDLAEILESLILTEKKSMGSEFGGIRTFSSENLGRVAAERLPELGFRVVPASSIRWRSPDAYVIDYIVIRSIQLREGVVVIKMSAVTEGRPCFAPAFSRERSFAYKFQKSGKEWVSELVKGSTPFSFSRSLRKYP